MIGRYRRPGLRPDFVEEVHEAVVDHEGDGNVQADSRHPRDSALVESPRPLVHHDLLGAVERVLVPVGLKSLHPGCVKYEDIVRNVLFLSMFIEIWVKLRFLYSLNTLNVSQRGKFSDLDINRGVACSFTTYF